MPLVNSFSFDALPSDDRIYRLYWAGLVQLAHTDDESPRIVAWLRAIDEAGHYIPQLPAYRVVQSAGAIPRLHIGSLWRNQAPYASLMIEDSRIIDLEIEAQPFWTPVRAADRNMPAGVDSNGRRHCWINPSDYPLILHEGGNTSTAAYTSWVVPMRTSKGLEVVVPCYELFRAFYAGSSELAWRLLSGPWTDVSKHFITSAALTMTDDGGSVLELEPAAGIGKGVISFLGALSTSKAARQCANRIHTDLLSNAQESGTQVAWLRATPPFWNERFHMRARVHQFESREGLMVTKIESATFPSDLRQIIYLENVYLPNSEDTENGGDATSSGRWSNSTSVPDKAHVESTGTRRPSARRFQLSVGQSFWMQAPTLDKASRRCMKGYSHTNEKEEMSSLPEQAVGVGSPRGQARSKHASFEHTGDPIKLDNIDRMSAVQALIDSLTGSVIEDWEEYALANPVIVDRSLFCGLPTDQGDAKAQAWAKGDGGESGDQPRLTWVVRLRVQGRHVYWIEIEHIKDSDQYCSLAISMLNGVELDGNTLNDILNLCAANRGRWPKIAPDPIAGKLSWVKAKHFPDQKGSLKAVTVTRPLTKLGVRWN